MFYVSENNKVYTEPKSLPTGKDEHLARSNPSDAPTFELGDTWDAPTYGEGATSDVPTYWEGATSYAPI